MQVQIKTYTLPPIDIRAVCLYAGVKKASSSDNNLILSCIGEYQNSANKVCYAIYDIKVDGSEVTFPFASVTSKSLSQRLKGCHKAVVFAGTIGIEIDRLIKKYSVLSPSKAVIFQAIGAERVESLLDAFCLELQSLAKNNGGDITARFSPGYGDLPLDFQRQIFTAINPQKHVGIYVTDSFIMTPSKSVTAIVGVSTKSEILL